MAENDWETLIPVCSKDVKSGKTKEAIFELFSLGVVTANDELVYSFNQEELVQQVEYFREVYNDEVKRWQESDKKTNTNDFVSGKINWAEELESYIKKNTRLQFDKNKIRIAAFRPFLNKFIYYDKVLIYNSYQQNHFFPINDVWKNKSIAVHCVSSDHSLSTLAVDRVHDSGFLTQENGETFTLPFYQIDHDVYQDNITDWALQLFNKKYEQKQTENASPVCYAGNRELREEFLMDVPAANIITKQNIFHYVYAVLYHPAYRIKYELNLKREFPRIPLYEDFYQWESWGKQLMNLHINYKSVAPFVFARNEVANKKEPKTKLRALKEEGIIQLDENTELHGIPAEAWGYNLGNRSALEWILDQYKEKKPTDPTIAEKFNTYRFADYKEDVIALLQKVCTVSLETMKIVGEMS